MEQNIFRYTWRYTKVQQFWMLLVVLASLPFYFLSLDLPKQIINGPITGIGFEAPDSTTSAARIAFSLPEFLGGTEFVLFSGFEIGRIETLFYLSFLFLGFVLINGGFKFYINTYKGRLGERMLRRLRFELFDRMLRFPVAHFRRVRASELATIIKDEVDPFGGFIGNAFVQPLFLASQALTALFFIFVQNASLGVIALVIVVMQVVIIPRLRRRLLVLGRRRQLTSRALAGRVGEVVDGISSIRVNDASNWERAEISKRLGEIFQIRFDIYQWKFLVRWINNIMAKLTPFIFYLIGGLFVIRGQLDIGALVASIAAYGELPGPMKDLIDWDQTRQDVQIRYEQVTEQFDIPNLVDPSAQELSLLPTVAIAGPIAVSNLSAVDDTDAVLLNEVTASIAPGENVAAVGPLGSGAEYLAEVLAGLLDPASGRMTINGQAVTELPEAVRGRRIGYVEPNTYFGQSSIRDALLYGVRHAPLKEAAPDKKTLSPRLLLEAKASGNFAADIADDWIDYDAAGVSNSAELLDKIRQILNVVGLDADVFKWGLAGRLTEEPGEELATKILAARAEFNARLADLSGDQFVERIEPGQYAEHASVIENFIFGLPVSDSSDEDLLLKHPHVKKTLTEADLIDPLFEMGRRTAATILELFGDLDPDNPILARMDLLAAEDIDDYRNRLRRIENVKAADASDEDQDAFLQLAFNYVEPKYRFGVMDDDLKARIVAARKVFRDTLPADLQDSIVFHDPDKVNRAASLQGNILFGRIVQSSAGATRRANEVLQETIRDCGLEEAVMELGLQFNVGSGAKRLSSAQQQRLALGRALLKQPDLLIVNRALSALDSLSQKDIIESIMEMEKTPGGWEFATFWVLANPALAQMFERVMVFEDGEIADDIPASEFDVDGSSLNAEEGAQDGDDDSIDEAVPAENA